jgi:DNA-binding NarL/FixJ family response regulator
MAKQARAKSRSAPKRVFIVDDHAVVREGLSALIDGESDLLVCGEAGSAAEAMSALDTANPDLVLVDLSLEGIGGLELIQNIKAAKPTLPTLVLSAHDESRYAQRAIRAGARGYIMKSKETGRLLEGIRLVLAGKIYLSQEMMQIFMAKMADRTSSVSQEPHVLLSNRELEVFDLIGHGLQTADIAEKLRLSEKTVRVHQAHIRKKLKLTTTIQLHQSAYHWVHIEGAI